MVKSAVRVFLRVRPCAGINSYILYGQDKKGVSISVPKTIDIKSGEKQTQSYQFKFDGVLKEAEQEEVYEACAAEILGSALEGYNSTVMCYGQTGAGKTYTMSGGKSSFKQRGIIPRMINHLFAEIRNLSDRQFKISIQYLEIYNESLYDLLDITTQPHELNIQENTKGVVNITGLKSAVVQSDTQAFQLFFEGETNRVIGAHQLNRESSRSHSIFTITIEMRMPGELGDKIVSKVNLVDLAGSERVSKTRSEGLVLREAGHINKSLSILEHVILALSDKSRDHIPFRSSKLTHVLKDSLGGNCKTVLVANIWGESSQLDETLSTCRFAQRMMCITCEIKANVVEDSSVRCTQLQSQVQDLQHELAMHDSMASRKNVAYGPYSDAQRAELKALVSTFLSAPNMGQSDSIEPLELISVRHMKEILRCCKEVYLDAASSSNGRSRIDSSLSNEASTSYVPNGARAAAAATENGLNYVGEEEAGGGGGLAGWQSGGVGVAPDFARPEQADGEVSSPGAIKVQPGGGMAVVDRLLAMQLQDGTANKRQERGLDFAASASGGGNSPLIDRKDALQEYKSSGPGAAKAALLDDNHARLKSSKRRAKELGLSINAAKKDLDHLKALSESLRAERQAKTGEGSQVLDAEEYSALMRIKELKQQYRDQYSELQMVKSEIEYTQQLCDACAQELAMEFNQWYLRNYGGEFSHYEGSEGDAALDSESLPSPSAKSTASGLSRHYPQEERGPPSSKPVQSFNTAPIASQGNSPSSAAKKPPNRKVLSSLLPSPKADEDAGNPDAAAFYNAQQHIVLKAANAAHRPGSIKKTRVPASFGATKH
ncbi:hypothetical protein CEUSTIGMA_g4903.t1 [Chlamydomonas eustigma]|uniref:Kinesin-like protein n=1 Tax=Chlamydomonas eustigma TaxID=1157962 RepID=A0A250X3F4_9CHLO|nr:hypothetical protein CEUSTIGMA_g4903.t1 [Chlamydomonas eustigma]|eukprot:GAX77459.1 hypothetical protein CEUSTIGMA_g4903.t1 [Chlamydomonas eustigma]